METATVRLAVQETGEKAFTYSNMEWENDMDYTCDNNRELSPAGSEQNTKPSSNEHQSMDPPNTFEGGPSTSSFSEQNTKPSSNEHQSMDPPNTFEGGPSTSSYRPDREKSSGSEGAVPKPRTTTGQSMLAKLNSRLIWFAFGAFLFLIMLNITGTSVTPKADLQIGPEVRLMMLGTSGAGKSATGNTILGRNAFRAEASPVSVTRNCQRWTEVVRGRRITVIDTPSIMDMWQSSGQEAECVQMASPGFHVFLLVIRVGRFTEEERNTVAWIKKNLQEEALMSTMIVFTGGDLLEGKPMEKFLRESVELQELLRLCGGRYHIMNNRETRDFEQVSELLNKIDKMMYDNKSIFDISRISLKEWRSSRLKEEERCMKKEREIREEEEKKRQESRKEIREVEKKRQEPELIRETASAEHSTIEENRMPDFTCMSEQREDHQDHEWSSSSDLYLTESDSDEDHLPSSDHQSMDTPNTFEENPFFPPHRSENVGGTSRASETDHQPRMKTQQSNVKEKSRNSFFQWVFRSALQALLLIFTLCYSSSQPHTGEADGDEVQSREESNRNHSPG
ncbi:hypothetical protein AOLI_G00235490 [Acnodon oligacanthus]